MATKARHLKTPLQLWIADNRKRLGLTPADLAQMTGVTTDTARGWESRGRPSEDALGILERRFGVAVPRETTYAEGDIGALVAAVRDQTAAIERQTMALTSILATALGTQNEDARAAVEELVDRLVSPRRDADPVSSGTQ